MLDEETLLKVADALGARDPYLNAVIMKHGYPPLWAREPGFQTLVKDNLRTTSITQLSTGSIRQANAAN